MPNVSLHLVRKAAPHIVQLWSFQGPSERKNLGPFGAHQVQCRFQFHYQEGRRGPFQVNHHFKDAWALLELTKFNLINSEQLRACQVLLIYLGSFGAHHV